MRFLVWTWRVVLVIVIGAFVATVYYMTHDVGTRMDAAMPTLNLITVIGTALLGAVWAVTRRYWHALILLGALGVIRGAFGFPKSTEPELLTEWQLNFLWVSIGVIGLALVVTLTTRAILSERQLRAVKAKAAPSIAPKPVAAAEAVAPAVVAAATDDTAAAEPTPAPDAGKDK